MEREKPMKRKTITIKILFSAAVLLSACAPEEKEPQLPQPESTTAAESELPETAAPVTEEPAEINQRPVITHKYPVLILCDGMRDIGDYSDNVESVIDPEDGELPYCNIGGIVGPGGEEEFQKLLTEDRPDLVEDYGSGFYFTLGGWHEDDELHPVTTFAYDSKGQLAVKEYRIRYLNRDEDNAIGALTVQVEGLNVRTGPSKDAEKAGTAWPAIEYLYYETQTDDEYTWYRIYDDLWAAGKDSWLEVTEY
jgi:hypothetical protein